MHKPGLCNLSLAVKHVNYKRNTKDRSQKLLCRIQSALLENKRAILHSNPTNCGEEGRELCALLNCLVNYGVVTRGRRPRLGRRTRGFLQISTFLDILQRPVCFLGELNGAEEGAEEIAFSRRNANIFRANARLSVCLYLDGRENKAATKIRPPRTPLLFFVLVFVQF